MFVPLVKESPGFKNLKELIIDSGICSLCGSCSILCKKIEYGDLPFLKENEACITTIEARKCGTDGCCFDNCPMTSFSKKNLESTFLGNESYDPDLGSYKKILSARPTNKKILPKAQNGGVVTSLISYALSDGLKDREYAGAIVTKRNKEWAPIPFFASNSEELLQSTESIYFRLPLSRQIHNLLCKKRNLIFVGTGCQTTGVRKFQYNFLNKMPTDSYRLFAIGIFCYENFPYQQFKEVIQDKSGVLISTIVKMDIKKGQLVINLKNGKVLQYPMKEFNSLVPESCKLCTNFTAELSDISIGSLGSKKGWNTVIIRSEAGLKLIERAEKNDIIETSIEVSIEKIRKTITRKKLLREEIAEKRRASGLYIPNFD
ncbi:MAG: Coenzyme F420 hydrogenase/dehydrogenase, beta subunit C-terminal domain [Candidatus Hermodarchaeota archaeon]